MITMKAVVKKYNTNENELVALKGINLEIKDGEFIAVMGASGSGKTTLLNIIGCMDQITDGEYYYNEQAVHTFTSTMADIFRRDNVGFVFQNFALLKDYTLRENVEVPLRAKGISGKKRKDLSEAILERVGLKDYINTVPTKISGGQQQRCAIARALVSGADLILADEPTGALDKATGQEIMDLLKTLNDEGRTVIIVTHDENVANRTKRIIKLEDGEIVG